MTYGGVILASWAAFLLVWVVGAFGVKRDVAGSGASRARYWLFHLGGAALLLWAAWRFTRGGGWGHSPGAAFSRVLLFTPSPALGWVAAIVTALGVAFAIWARVYLGRNWSPAPAMKEQHELVTGGPYRFVRHPIYTGMIAAAFGAALTGRLPGLVLLLLLCVMFYLRLDREERIMLALFADSYPAYQARTKRLIPFIW